MSETSLPRRRLLSDYESDALDAIMAWRNPTTSWFTKASKSIQTSLNALSDQLRKIPGIDWTIDNVIVGLITLTNEISQDLVWRESIFENFRKAGYRSVYTLDDIALLDLASIDSALKGLPAKYDSLAAVGGVATGIAGPAGILPDIVALLTLNLRAAGEYASYCGFDISDPAERLYALHILEAASLPRDQIPYAIPPRLHQAPQSVARRKTLNTVEQFAVGGTIRGIAKSIALRITKNKLTHFIPIAGAVAAGGFNSLYTHTVCDAAFHLYRERFLDRKYNL